MRVLFAVDGSEGSFAALRQVGALLGSADRVALYCSPPAGLKFSLGSDPDLVAKAQQGVVEAIVAKAREHLPEPHAAAAERLTGTQDPRRGIVTAAEEWGANLIVVGARGLGAIKRLLLGSVSRAVVHSSHIPVWVARPGDERPAGTPVRVLLAGEDPEHAAPLARALSQFTWPAGSSCRALAVVPSLFAGQVPEWLENQARSPDVEEMVHAWVQEHDEEIRTAQAKMDGFLTELPAGLSDRQALVVEGEPSSVILTTIGEQQIDVVVLGARHKNWLRTTLLGSTSEAVLNHAPSSVLIVPHG